MPTASALLDRDALDEVLREWAIESGERLRAARVQFGWKQPMVAKLAGTTAETVCRVELGKLTPRENMRIALATAVGRNAADIWPPLTRREVMRRAGESEAGAAA